MKSIQKILVFLLIFSYISCTCSSFENITDTSELLNGAFIDNNASVSTCKTRTLSPLEIQNGGYQCCYERIYCDLEDIKLDIQSCGFVTKQQLDQLGNLVKVYKDAGCKEVEIKCNCNFVSHLGLTMIFLILTFTLF